MKYIAKVRYGTSRHGCIEYMSKVCGELGPNWGGNSVVAFDTVDEAKQVVLDWCTKQRAALLKAGLHSGKAWNRTAPGAWHYEPAEENPYITTVSR